MSYLVSTGPHSLLPNSIPNRTWKFDTLTAVEMPQVARSLNVLVVGGGLGGLATALTLQTDGHLVRVIDAVPRFEEVSIQFIFSDPSPWPGN